MKRMSIKPVLIVIGLVGIIGGALILPVDKCSGVFLISTGFAAVAGLALSLIDLDSLPTRDHAKPVAYKEIPSKIAGVSYNDPITERPRQSIIRRRVRSGTILTPQTEPGNKYKDNAVALWLNDRFHIGYIRSGDLSKEVASALRSDKQVTVEVLNVTGGTAKKPTRGVNILIRIEI